MWLKKTTIDVYNTRLRETVYKNIDDLERHNWSIHTRRGFMPDEAINYWLNNSQYKNKLITYLNSIANTSRSSQKYRSKAIETYLKIKELTESTDSIPKTITLKNKDNINENKLIGTYRIRDSLGQGFAKKYKVSQLKNQLYVKLDDRGKYKLNWHKEFIYFGANGKVICDFNKSDTLIIRLDLRNAIFVRDNSNPQ